MRAHQLAAVVSAALAACAPEAVLQTEGGGGAPGISANAQPLTNPPATGCNPASFGGHDYWFCPSLHSWQNARSKCQAIGYDLAQINDAAENQFVRTRLFGDAWIGGRDSASEGAWRWADTETQFWQGKANGAPVGGAYTNWSSGQPDDQFNQDCLNFKGTTLGAGKWSDDSCSVLHHFVCEGDLCPDDPAKSEPGQCGCGTPDVDADGDGTADCNDECPDDPDKTDPGACGCGVSDQDSDGDGTLDCGDQCPDDATKTVAGDCGCNDDPAPAGAACSDGLCSANDVCNGQGRCGNPNDCGPPDTLCTYLKRGGIQYWLCSNTRSFADARQRCQNVGMDLAGIESEGEDDFITQQAGFGTDVFVGGSDSASEGNFTWLATGTQFWTGGVSGQAVGGAYTNWDTLQPTNTAPLNADCVVKDPSDLGQWEATLCSVTERYVCEQGLSCAGQCGGYGDGCWCDSTCDGFGDCCPDKTAECGEDGPPEGSCEDLCGGAAEDCFCDTQCEDFGDCCLDKDDFCEDESPTEGSCVGQCGGDAGSCSCDDLCAEFGDCCEDKFDVCGGEPPAEGSCEDQCGNQSGSCYCDEACDVLGDCCPDKVDFCAAPPPPVEGSCMGQCGGLSGDCYCDAACHVTGDCCPDKIAICGDESQPPATGTCDGACGEQAGDCFCDDGCEAFGDCCPDKVELCGGPEP